MTQALVIEDNQIVNLVVPVADIFAGDLTTDEVNMKAYNHAAFLVVQGVNGGDHTTFTVESCSDASGSDNTAIGFNYSSTTGNAALTDRDVWAANTKATASGFITTNSANSRSFILEIDADDLVDGHEFVRMVATESGSTGIIGSVICILSEPRFARDGKSTVLA